MVREASVPTKKTEEKDFKNKLEEFAAGADGGVVKVPSPTRKKAPGSKSINVYFTQEEHDLLKTAAKQEGRSIQKQIIFSLMRDLKSNI